MFIEKRELIYICDICGKEHSDGVVETKNAISYMEFSPPKDWDTEGYRQKKATHTFRRSDSYLHTDPFKMLCDGCKAIEEIIT